MQRQWIRKKSCPDTESCKNAVTFIISGYSVFYEGESIYLGSFPFHDKGTKL